jgi:hypothetical protein
VVGDAVGGGVVVAVDVDVGPTWTGSDVTIWNEYSPAVDAGPSPGPAFRYQTHSPPPAEAVGAVSWAPLGVVIATVGALDTCIPVMHTGRSKGRSSVILKTVVDVPEGTLTAFGFEQFSPIGMMLVKEEIDPGLAGLFPIGEPPGPPPS